jgi:hypothetical protein
VKRGRRSGDVPAWNAHASNGFAAARRLFVNVADAGAVTVDLCPIACTTLHGHANFLS